MKLGLMIVAALVVVTVFLGLLWRREARRIGDSASKLPLLVTLVVVTLGVGLYMALGYNSDTGEWLSDQSRLDHIANQLIAGKPPGKVADNVKAGPMARVLQRRLAQHPSSPGWYALALIYDQMQAPGPAVAAARRSLALASPDRVDDTRLLLARSLISKANGKLTPEAEKQIDKVLKKNPHHDGAWMLLAMSATKGGKPDLAIKAWQSLLSRHGDSQAGDMLRRGLAMAKEQKKRLAAMGHIHVTVTAASGVDDGGTLFLFVRKKGGSGQPLAAKRQLVDKFPVSVDLTPDNWLQSFPDAGTPLTVGARYSSGPGGSVENAGERVSPVLLKKGKNGLSASLHLTAPSD